MLSASNNFSTVAIASAQSVSLRDANALILGASTVSGSLALTANGDLTQSGALLVSGTTSLGASGNIVLPNALNTFTGAITISAAIVGNPANVTIDNSTAMSVGGFTASGFILLTTESGDLAKTGAMTSTAASGGNITLAAAISQPRGTASGGDVKSTAGALTPGAGAEALVYSGAVASTNLTGFAPASGSGDFRYNRQYLDPVGAPGVGSGPVFILYREQPSVTITPNAATKVYGTADPTFTFSAVGLQNGDTALQAGIDNTVITRQPGETVAGSPYLFLAGSSLSQLGYNLSVVNPSSAGLTITAATLTYTANPASRAYGAGDPAFSGTVTGFVNGETQATATTGTLTFTTPAVATSNVGSYAINGSGLTANNGNYAFVQAAANATALTITQAALSIGAVGDSKTYDGNAISLGVPTTSGLVGGDTVTASQSFDSRNVGARTLSVDPGYVIADGNGGANYAVTLQTASGTISQAALTIGAVSDSKTYDGNASSLGVPTTAGLVGGDTVTASQSFDSKNAGARTLSVDPGYVIADGNGGANYSVTLQTAGGTISQAALSIGAVSDSKL